MDQNKANKLTEIGYKVRLTCGTCKHFLQRSDDDFGDCQTHEYVHRKHSGGVRKLSVVRYGSCDKWEEGDTNFLHGFTKFLTITSK